MAEKPRDDVQLPGVDDVSPEATDPVTAAINAVAGTPPTEPEPLAAIVFPRALRRGQTPPERIVTIKDAPPPYDDIQVALWVNPSSAIIQRVAESRPMLREFLFFFVRDWNLELEPEVEGGQIEKAPIEPENFALLTEEYIGWLGEEFRKARTNPLVVPPETTLAAVRESRLSGGTTRNTRNGSG